MNITRVEEKHLIGMAELEKENFSHPWSYDSLKKGIHRDDTIYLVALDQNKVIGYLGVWQSLDEGELVSIVVDSNYRGKMVAKALLNHLTIEAKVKNMKHIYLEVRVSNERAIHLYENYGFKQLGIRKNFYDHPKEDAKLMMLPVDIF